MDKLAYRYLDTDFTKAFYPLSSVLEVNCYAVLSLDILGRLNLIDVQKMIEFIWDCYNPTEHGFIGQAYSVSLDNNFKVSTADNTYYAAITLDLLLNSDWSSNITERDNIINYFNSLQSTNVFEWYYGGFYNDLNGGFQSLDIFEPNLISSYYSIKGLETFGMEDSIINASFYQYINGLYVDSANRDYFKAFYPPPENYSNIIASAIGLELCDTKNYIIDRNDIINFVLDGRNTIGIWKASTNYLNAELLDTYQVLHALNEAGEISRLSLNDKDNIVIGIQNFHQHKGYSLLSEDYTSLELINTIISTAKNLDRVAELNLQDLYNQIENIYDSNAGNTGFYASLDLDLVNKEFRSWPIEYYSSGNHFYIEEENIMRTHKTAYFAIDSLIKLFKLDDFESVHNLNQLLNDILNSQFLESSAYRNHGAFLPHISYNARLPEDQNKSIFLENSFYTIKTLELLASYLSLGDITNLAFNESALDSYIREYIIETPSLLYFKPYNSNNPNNILENTYFMIYILKATNQYDLDDLKIKDFIVQNLDCTNLKNLYYCYKIDDLLNLNVGFNLDLSSSIIELLYSDILNEYYFSTNKQLILQKSFLWINEMSEKDYGLNIAAEFLDNTGIIIMDLNVSYKSLLGPKLLYNPVVYSEIYKNEQFHDIEYLNEEISDINKFSLDYNVIIDEQFRFEIYLDDGILINHLKLAEYVYLGEKNNLPSGNENSLNFTDDIILSIPLMFSIITIPSCVIFLSSRKKRNLQSKYQSK
jgi:hypothetical protein